MTWWYHRKLRKNEVKEEKLKKEKNKILEDVMETETYKVAKEILDTYGTLDQFPKPSKVNSSYLISWLQNNNIFVSDGCAELI